MTIEIDFHNTAFWQSVLLGVIVGVVPISIAPLIFRLILPDTDDGVLPGSVGELIARYIYGTASVLLGGGVAMVLVGLWWVPLVFLAVAGVCGFVVWLRYHSVDYARNVRQNGMQRKADDDLK